MPGLMARHSSHDVTSARRPFVVDCQTHLVLPEMLDLMRRRTNEPLVVDRDGTTILKMGRWLRTVPPHYTSVADKLAMMDASGIDHALLSVNDPGPEWFGTDGCRIAALIHDALASLVPLYPGRFSWLCTLPLQDERAARAELSRCLGMPGFRGILLYTNLAGVAGRSTCGRSQATICAIFTWTSPPRSRRRCGSPSTSRRPTNSCSRATIRGSMRPRSWERSNSSAYAPKQRPESSVATPDGSSSSDRVFSGPVLHYAWEPTQRLRRQGISRMFETRGFFYERLFVAGTRRPAVSLVAHLCRCQIEMYSNMMSPASRGSGDYSLCPLREVISRAFPYGSFEGRPTG